MAPSLPFTLPDKSKWPLPLLLYCLSPPSAGISKWQEEAPVSSIEVKLGRQGAGEVNNACCSAGGPQFHSQHPH